LKTLETKGKFGSARERVIKVFRVFSDLGREDSGISLPATAFANALSKPANSLTDLSLGCRVEKSRGVGVLMYV